MREPNIQAGIFKTLLGIMVLILLLIALGSPGRSKPPDGRSDANANEPMLMLVLKPP